MAKNTFSEGTIVISPKYGKGVIKQIITKSTGYALIDFNGDERKLLKKYADLTYEDGTPCFTGKKKEKLSKQEKDKKAIEKFNKQSNLDKIKKSLLSGGSYYRSGIAYDMWLSDLDEIEEKAKEVKDDFIQKVIKSVIKFNKISEKQAYVIARFANKNGLTYNDESRHDAHIYETDENKDNIKTEKLKEHNENFADIIKQMDFAAEKLVKPKIRLSKNLVLTRAKKGSKNDGVVYVSNGDWDNNIYYGRINRDGTHNITDDDVIAKIVKYQENPQKYAKEYGDKYHSCSFCGLELTNENSKEYGYGPVCAEKFGLPHTYSKNKKDTPKIVSKKEDKKVEVKQDKTPKINIPKIKNTEMYKIKTYIDNGLILSKLSEKTKQNIADIKLLSDNFSVSDEDAFKLDELLVTAPSTKNEIDAAMPKKVKIVKPKKTKIIKTVKAPEVEVKDEEKTPAYYKAEITKIRSKLREFIPTLELETLLDNARIRCIYNKCEYVNEEGEFFAKKLIELVEIWEQMPKLYGTEKIPQDEKTVWLHYFIGGSDWYLVERDEKGERAFGYAVLNGDLQNAELGYIELDAIVNSTFSVNKGMQAELDLYFYPRSLGEIIKKDEDPEVKKQEKQKVAYVNKIINFLEENGYTHEEELDFKNSFRVYKDDNYYKIYYFPKYIEIFKITDPKGDDFKDVYFLGNIDISDDEKHNLENILNDVLEILEQYSNIVIEWSESSAEENIHIKNLDELNNFLKKAGFTEKPTETYIKNKVWFSGIEHYIQIDNSKKEGDFNFEKEHIRDYLKREYPKYDFSVFDDKQFNQKQSKTPDYKAAIEAMEVMFETTGEQKYNDAIEALKLML